MKNRHSLVTALLFAAPIALTVGACKPEVKELDADVQSLLEHPNRHVPGDVTVRGKVDRPLGTGAFILEDPDAEMHEIVVIMDGESDQTVNVSPGDLVQVTGELSIKNHNIQPEIREAFGPDPGLDSTPLLKSAVVVDLGDA